MKKYLISSGTVLLFTVVQLMAAAQPSNATTNITAAATAAVASPAATPAVKAAAAPASSPAASAAVAPSASAVAKPVDSAAAAPTAGAVATPAATSVAGAATPSAASAVAKPAVGAAETPAATPVAGAATPSAASAVAKPVVGAAGTNVATPAATPAASADSKPASKAGNGPPGYTNFALIWQRPIFDSTRQPYRQGMIMNTVYAPQVRPPAVQEIRLCGTWNKIGKGIDAVFSGYGASQSGQYDVGDSIDGLKIVAVSTNEVKLVDTNSASTNMFTVGVGWGLSRTNGGQWATKMMLTTYPIPYVVERAPTPADTGGGFGQQPQFGGRQFADTTATADDTGNTGFGGRRGGRGNRGGGGGGFGNGGGGGFGNGGGGGFGNGGGGGGGFGTTATAPAAAADPSVLARLQARRAQEGN